MNSYRQETLPGGQCRGEKIIVKLAKANKAERVLGLVARDLVHLQGTSFRPP